MNNLTIKQLRYFDALARYRHFGNAADACKVTQPALSMQIKELELELGAPLFERSSRSLRPTGLGKELTKRVADILRAVDELSELARVSKTRLVGNLRLGVIPTIAPYLLPDVVKQLSTELPEIDLYIRETLTATLIKELSEGRLDAAIVALPISEDSLEEYRLFDENFLLVRPYADRKAVVPTPENLREMHLLLLEEGHCFREQALSFCSLSASKPKEIVDGTSLSTLVQMVGAGLGVTFVPEMAIDVETRSAKVSVARFPKPEPCRTIGMIWRKSNPISPQLADIAKIVECCAKNTSLADN